MVSCIVHVLDPKEGVWVTQLGSHAYSWSNHHGGAFGDGSVDREIWLSGPGSVVHLHGQGARALTGNATRQFSKGRCGRPKGSKPLWHAYH